MSICYLHLGSNIGDRKQHLVDARVLIDSTIGEILQYSLIYETEAWGNRNQNDFLNQAIKLETDLNPEEVLEKILLIEKSLGRIRTKKWEPRKIDIDIIFYDDIIVETPSLKIPHPYMHERNFVLEPMNDIASDLCHPKLKETVKDLFTKSMDKGVVKILPS